MMLLARLWLGKLTGPLLQAGFLLLALVTFGAVQRNTGAKAARSRDKEKDREHADRISARIDAHADSRMRQFDDAGYRD